MSSRGWKKKRRCRANAGLKVKSLESDCADVADFADD
jgi:hypothetical protein